MSGDPRIREVVADSYDMADSRIVEAYEEMGIVKRMSLQERVNAPAPTQVSNRTIYDRCLEWGSKVLKTNGNWVWLESPLHYRFKVRPPQQHEANGKFDIERMLDALALPWAVFIAAEILDVNELKRAGDGFKRSGGPDEKPDDPMGPCSICEDDVQRVHMVKRGRKIAHSYCINKPVEAQPDNRGYVAAPPPTPEEIDTVPEAELASSEEVAVVDVPSRSRYINSVFDLLVERGDPMSNQAVAEAVGITPQQATSAMAALCTQGVVTRIKAGVYQARPDVMRRQGTLGVVVSSSERPFGTVPPGYVVQPTPRPFAVEGEEPSSEEDDTLNDLLDLMAPNGFKARHLPLIDNFKRCALALMREVNGGA